MTYKDSTKSLCPRCKKLIDAEVFEKQGKIFMRKKCKEHGNFLSLISSDAEFYKKALEFDLPGQKSLFRETKRKKGCPNDCGLCEEHKQHTCLALIDITNKCNLSCQNCYASSEADGKFLSLKQISGMLDQYIKCEKNPDVLQISGGEPTLHPQILEIIKLARKNKILMIMLNTNGIRIAEDENFVKELSKFKGRFEVYLQFDGFKEETYRKLRGKNLLDTKLKAIQNLVKYKIPITLVATIKKGVNEDEIGSIIRFGLTTDFIRGATFQPIFFAGRHEKSDIMNRITGTDVLRRIEEQTKGIFKKTDFIPLPCPHPACCIITYSIKIKNKIVPITRLIDVKKNLSYLGNQIAFSPKKIVKKALKNLFSASASLESIKTLKAFSCCIPYKNLILNKKNREEFANDAFRIVVKPFMDAYNFDIKRAQKCCIHFILPDKRFIPFCVYNNLYRGKQ